MFNDVITHLVLRFRDMLYWDSRRLTYPKLMEYAEAIRRAGGIDGIWGFIDGTVRPSRGDEALARGLQRPQAHPLAEISVCHDPDGSSPT